MADVDTRGAENSTDAVTTSRAWQKLAAAILVLLTFQAATWGATAYSKADRVNVRSRPGFIGEIVTQLKKGQAVNVLDTVTLKKPAADEPPTWVKIELPPDSPAWANAEFVDPSNGLVKGDLLNVRAGPTYDHGIVGRAKRGSTLKILAPATNGWLRVAAPAGSVGFVPASWMADSVAAVEASAAPAVTKTPPAAGATAAAGIAAPRATSGTNAASPNILTNVAAKTTIAATTNAAPRTVATRSASSSATNKTTTATPASRSASRPVSDNAWLEQFVSRPANQTNSGNGVSPAAPAKSSTPAPASAPTTSPAPVPATTPVPSAAVTPSATEPFPEPVVPSEPPKPDGRWVRREGLVVRPVNISAPSFYALKMRGHGGLMNFLIAPKSGPEAFREYRGRVVIVTGREYLDRRPYWRDIPLLDVETIEAVR